MLLLKVFIVSFCCIISLQHFSQCAEERKGRATEKDTAKQSNIFTIRKLDTATKDGNMKQSKPQKQQKQEIKLQQQQQLLQQQQQQSKTGKVKSANILTETTKPPRTKKLKSATKSSHSMNKKLLSKLGFTKVKAPNSHNRKRLAIESRRHASPDDSHMFIIKLPPNLYYYSSPKEAGVQANSKNALVQHAQTEIETKPAVLNADANGKKVSFPFSSNGKPGRIYHWNLPVIKKILEDKQRFPSVADATKDQLIDIKDIPTWNKPWENETFEKSYGKSSMMSYKKSLKRKSPSYYAPATAVNKNSFNKYFAGNGKPRGFYVIKENQKKPLFYKNIIS